VQANIVAARYEVQRVSLSRLTTFTPRLTQDVSATFTTPSGSAATRVKLSIALPAGWNAAKTSASIAGPVAPGASVRATFQITSPATTGGSFLTARGEWKEAATRQPQS
jgi:non-reducing end alpha-L-arabinofuranosidase